jgi:hypothetical protein
LRQSARKLLSALASGAIAAGLLAAFCAAPATASDPLQMIRLRVEGGEENWHPDNDFELFWGRPADPSQEAAVSAIYRVRNATGQTVIPDTRVAGKWQWIGNIHLPSGPGQYTIEVWLEGKSGTTGQPLSATLLLDDRPPGSIGLSLPAGWIGAGATPILHLGHPAGPQPVSGIRGYAISIDGDPAGSPCAAPDRCSDAETDLRGGIDEDTMSLGIMPEGVGIVHAVAVSGSGLKSTAVASVTVHVDATRPAIELHGLPGGWARTPVRLTASATDWLSGMVAAGPIGPSTLIAVDGAVPRREAGDTVAATVTGNGVHLVSAFARDAAGNLSDGKAPSSQAVVRIDQDPPRVAFARSQDPAEPERIEATVSDPLSGPNPARGSIAVRPAGTARQFAPLPTTVAGGKLTAHWSSDTVAPGSYEFRATGYDAAGNSAVADRRASGARMVLASPLKKLTTIRAGLGGKRLVWHRCARADGQRRCRPETIRSFERRPATRSVPYGRGMPFAGQLTSASGAALAGMPVEVIETFGAGADPARRTTTVATAADGTFLTHLQPGPSREVEAVFAGNRLLARAAGRRLRLLVLAGVRMHASAASAAVGGAPVLFRGQLFGAGGSIPPGGRPIELQFRLPRGEWSEFRTIQTDAHGRFRYPYSFSDDDSRGVRFEFRAYAPAEDGWPYEPASSRPVFVTGR